MRYTVIILSFMLVCLSCGRHYGTVVVISANAEWEAFMDIPANENVILNTSPYGQWFIQKDIVYFHGGWGKIDAAGSTQYIIDTFHPNLIINIGTAGGFHGKVNKGDIIIVNKTITYDIYEKMGDSTEAIKYYTTNLDCPNIKLNKHIKKSVMVSADRDLIPENIDELQKKYNAVASDWESSAIAHIAKKNGTKCYIIRGISDVVYKSGSETYGNIDNFEKESRVIMKKLISLLKNEKII